MAYLREKADAWRIIDAVGGFGAPIASQNTDGPMSHEILKVQKSAHVVVVEINCEPVCDETMFVRLSSEFADLGERIAWDEDARVVILAYKGRWFPPDGRELAGLCSQAGVPSLVGSVAGLKVPVLGAINGDAIGLGLELALACDIRIGTRGARFGLPAVSRGSMPSAGGTQRLPRLVGYGKAAEMILTGALVDAEEACRIGLLTRLVAPDALMGAALTMAGEMASKSPLALAYVKEALQKGMDLTLDQGMRMELDLYLLLFTTGDRREGITAFKEKRKPRFKGA